MDTFSPQKRSWIMARVKSVKNKSTEEEMRAVLREYGIKGWRRSYPLFGKPDFTFPREKVALFVDGCFWHGHFYRSAKYQIESNLCQRMLRGSNVGIIATH